MLFPFGNKNKKAEMNDIDLIKKSIAERERDIIVYADNIKNNLAGVDLYKELKRQKELELVALKVSLEDLEK